MMSIRASIRALIYKLFPTISDFESFICDYFFEEYNQIGQANLSYDGKITGLMERRSEDEILDGLYSYIKRNENSYTVEHYLYIKEGIEKLMDGEPLDFLKEIRRKHTTHNTQNRSKPQSVFQKLLRLIGFLYIWEQICAIWKFLGLQIRIENGNLVIASAVGCLVITGGIWSCYYRANPAFVSNTFHHSATSELLDFCIEDLSVYFDPAATSKTDTQSINEPLMNSISLAYWKNDFPNYYSRVSNAAYASSATRFSHTAQSLSSSPHFADCSSFSTSVNRIHVKIKIVLSSKIEGNVRTCPHGNECIDSSIRYESCYFSFSTHDSQHEYECPIGEFALSSNGVRYLDTGTVPEISNYQKSHLLESCQGPISAIALLRSCRRKTN